MCPKTLIVVLGSSLYRMASPDLFYVAPHLQNFVKTGKVSAADMAIDGGSNKIRVGIVSRHLRWHSIGKFMRGFIDRFPRQRVGLIVFFIAQQVQC